MNIRRMKIIPALSLALLALLLSSGVNAQFMTIDREKEPEKKEEPAPRKKPGDESRLARGIKAQRVEGLPSAVMITWERDPEFRDEFIVAASGNVINTMERALKARTVRIVPHGEKNVVLDLNLKPGMYFYAVIASGSLKMQAAELMEDVNFTSKPVIIPAGQEEVGTIAVTGLQARVIGDSIAIIQWEKIQGKGNIYNVYRGLGVIDSPERLRKAERIASVTDQSQYVDQGLAAGTYYYAVTFRLPEREENLRLAVGENFTTDGLFLKGEKKEVDRYRVHAMKAQMKDGNAVLTWDHAGKTGDRYFKLFRSQNPVADSGEIKPEDFIDDVDITLGTYIDRGVKPGVYYYGLVPYEESAGSTKAIVPGVNVLKEPLATSVAEGKSPAKEPVPTEKGKIDPARTVDAPPGAVDDIIRRTFFTGCYHQAIKELERAAAATDKEKERARALLFIGRSYVELKRYRKAISFFVDKDVVRLFPAEASFWREYATLRLN
jgi:hypothetical protein